MKVPLLDLSYQNKPHREKMLKAIEQIIESNRFILGPEVKQLEKDVARYCGVSHAVGVSSGTDALLIALMVAGIGRGDEVVTAPYTFFATAGAIARVGATPVFVDIEPHTYNMNPHQLSRVINSKTKAVMPVHLYGQTADMNPILNAARSSGIYVIEDAAQAIGAEYRDGRRAGAMGDMGCFSFFPSKNLGALGDGGMVTTNNAEWAEKLAVFRVHGSKPKYIHPWVGGNFRLDALQAAVLRIKFPHLDRWTRDRQANAAVYDELFTQSGLTRNKIVTLPQPAYREAGVRHFHIYNQYIIRVRDREGLIAHLRAHEIGTEIYYPLPLHLQQCFKDLGYKKGDFTESEKAAEETLAIPVFPGLTRDQQTYVVETIHQYYKRK